MSSCISAVFDKAITHYRISLIFFFPSKLLTGSVHTQLVSVLLYWHVFHEYE